MINVMGFIDGTISKVLMEQFLKIMNIITNYFDIVRRKIQHYQISCGTYSKDV